MVASHAPEEGRPNGPKHRVTNACFYLLFSIYYIYDYQNQTVNLHVTWPPKTVLDIYFSEPTHFLCILSHSLCLLMCPFTQLPVSSLCVYFLICCVLLRSVMLLFAIVWITVYTHLMFTDNSNSNQLKIYYCHTVTGRVNELMTVGKRGLNTRGSWGRISQTHYLSKQTSKWRCHGVTG